MVGRLLIIEVVILIRLHALARKVWNREFEALRVESFDFYFLQLEVALGKFFACKFALFGSCLNVAHIMFLLNVYVSVLNDLMYLGAQDCSDELWGTLQSHQGRIKFAFFELERLSADGVKLDILFLW